MNRVTTLIADDEPLARAGLEEWVAATPSLELVASVVNGNDALAEIRRLKPALVLIDIQMPGLTGLEVVRALIGDGGELPAVIFATAYDAHAIAAFELHAVDYLLKPYARERFDEAVRHAIAHLGTAAAPLLPALDEAGGLADAPLTRIMVRDQGRLFPIRVENIEHLRSDTKYTLIASRGHHFLVRLPITHFEKRLNPDVFLKISRSCIVNLDFVASMTPDESSQFVVTMKDGTVVTASREISKQLRADSI